MKWGPLQKAYSNAFLTPKDYHPHFSHVLHRRFYSRVKAREANTRCRMCTFFTESVEQLDSCAQLAPLKMWLRATTKEYSWYDSDQKQCFMLGLHPHDKHGDGSVSLWLLMWSALIVNLIKISTEGAVLNTDVICKKALETFMTRASSLLFRAKTFHRSVMSKTGGSPPESYKKFSRLLAPLGEIRPSAELINMEPELSWSTPFLGALEEAGLGHLLKTKAPHGAGSSSTECFSNQHVPPEREIHNPLAPNGSRGLRRRVAFQPSRIPSETVPPSK
jgi:hypothetical protein